MSKMDALRAMREAKYERNQAGAASRSSTPTTRARATPPVAPAVASSDSRPEAAGTQNASKAAESLGSCGHKSMNGRACTREAGHTEKSHRYS
jgi:hypothetical protein